MGLHEGARLRSTRTVFFLLPLAALVSACASVTGSLGPANSGALSSAQYGTSTDRVQRHVYAGVGAGLSRLEPDTSERSDFDVNDRVEPAGQVTLGIDLTKHFSAELHSADLGSAGLSPVGRINYHIHGGSVLLYAGKNRHNFKRRGFSGYARVGLGYLDGSSVGEVPFVIDNQTHFLVGAGLEYMTALGIGLRLEGISFDDDVQYGQLAAVYRLGRRQQNRPVEIAASMPAYKVHATTIEPLVQAAPRVAAALPVPVYNCSEIGEALEGVTFHTESAELTEKASLHLDAVALGLSHCASVPVQVTAHTDGWGSKSYNQRLSQRRAESVLDYLQEQGVSEDRLTSKAYGETKPIASNRTAEGRQANRRVELVPGQ